MNFEYVVWSVFLLTTVMAIRATYRWKIGSSESHLAFGLWVATGAVAAIGLALAETRWFPGPAMIGNPRGSVRDFLLVLSIPTIPLFGLAVLAILIRDVAENRFDHGLRMLKEGLCPICEYSQSDGNQRCPECGWPVIRPHSPLLWPVSPEPVLRWPMRRSQAQSLYVKWMMSVRSDVGAHESAVDPTEAATYQLVYQACMKQRRWPTAIFHSNDAWNLIAPGSPSSIKRKLQEKLMLRLAYSDFTDFQSLRFGQVVTLIHQKVTVRQR